MDLSHLRWQKTREYYQRLLRAKGWSHNELARQIDAVHPPMTAVHRFFDPDHTYGRIPTIIAAMDRIFGQPVGTGRHLLHEGLASNSEGFGCLTDLDAWEDEIRTGHYTAYGRKRLLARIKQMRAEMDLLRTEMDHDTKQALEPTDTAQRKQPEARR